MSVAARFVAASGQRLESAAAAVAVGETEYTWAGWVYLNELSISRCYGARDPGGAGGWEVGFDGNWFATAYGPSGSGVVFTSGAPSPVNAWRHVCTWRTISPDAISLQIDNGTVFTASLPGPVAAGSSPLHVGNVGSWGSRYWDGRIGPVGRWNRLLTDEEQGWLHNGGRGLPYEGLPPSLLTGLVAWWPLDEAGGIRRDVHGGNDLTPVNGPGWGLGHVGGADDGGADDAGASLLLQRMLGD